MNDYANSLQNQTQQNDPEWDYTKCRCENNGDYCDYCENFYYPPDAEDVLEKENPETI